MSPPTKTAHANYISRDRPVPVPSLGARPSGRSHRDQRQKGGGKGIDGRLYFHDGGPAGSTKQIIFSMKACHTLVPSFIHVLVGVIDREKAQIGVLLSFMVPTAGMRTEAASAGFYTSPWGGNYPRLQLLTVGQLLESKQFEYPHLTGGNVTHRRAPRELKVADQGELGYENPPPSN